MSAGASITSWRALGTSVHVLVSDEAWAREACEAVETVLDEVDRTYSRFRPDSELSRVNAAAGTRRAVSPLFLMALEAALRTAEMTGGAVDPTIGRAIRLAGYDADFDRIATRAGPIELRAEPIAGWRAVSLDRSDRSIRVPAGVELDLGSSGKALAADLGAAAALRAMGSGGVLVSLGGDIATAGVPPPGGWRVLVSEDSDTRPDSDGEVVAIQGGALATSSTTVRRWSRGGVELHHLIDPATGLPARGPWRTATAVAATCVDANAVATAAIILGAAASAWIARVQIPVRLVTIDGRVRRVGAWPDA